jgi:hypothetical protein
MERYAPLNTPPFPFPGKDVASTMPIRRALSAYVFRLYGIVLDDFNYGRLNLYLTLMHKVFIKKLVRRTRDLE